MKSNIKNNRIILVILLLFSVSCSDFFELERPPQNPWNTVEEFERVPIGLCYSLFSGDQWNIAWVNAHITKVCMGDDVNWAGDATYGYWRKTTEFNTYTDKNSYMLYRPIAAANNALDFLAVSDGNPFPSETDENSVENLNRIIGEIHFVRAYSYYLLITTFGHAFVPGGDNSTKDIPMPTSYPKSIDEAKNPKIGTTQEIYDLIVEDLIKAKELLPEKYKSGVHHPSYQVRANKFAASAMLARAYMLRGEYDKAKTECDYIIDQNGGEYDLTENPIEAFNKSSLSRGREVIFYAPYYDVTLLTPNHLSVFNQTWNNAQCNWCESRMAETVIKRIGWMDDPLTDTSFNNAAHRDKRFQQLFAVRYPINMVQSGQSTDNRSMINTITTVWTNKFYRGPANMNTNVPLIRLAEVILTRSIVRFRAGDLSGAASDLNIVRRRAWDENVGGPFQPTNAGTVTEQIINDERLVEMFNEADRLDYLRSLKVDIPLGERGPGAEPYTSKSFVWDIPVRETIYNDGL